MGIGNEHTTFAARAYTRVTMLNKNLVMAICASQILHISCVVCVCNTQRFPNEMPEFPLGNLAHIARLI